MDSFRLNDTWFEPLARQWLAEAAMSLGEIRLIVDGTKVGFGHRFLIVCLAYRQRAVPLAWTYQPYCRGHCTATVQLALLRYVHRMKPKDVRVILIGDSEFGVGALL